MSIFYVSHIHILLGNENINKSQIMFFTKNLMIGVNSRSCQNFQHIIETSKQKFDVDKLMGT